MYSDLYHFTNKLRLGLLGLTIVSLVQNFELYNLKTRLTDHENRLFNLEKEANKVYFE